MGFFSSSKSHLDHLEADCDTIARQAAEAIEQARRTLRGKYEYMQPEERADHFRKAADAFVKLPKALASARQRQETMEKDDCPKEDLLKAQSLLVGANLDVEKARKAVGDARDDLLAGVAEIEQFYGTRSREARKTRRVLADLPPLD